MLTILKNEANFTKYLKPDLDMPRQTKKEIEMLR